MSKQSTEFLAGSTLLLAGHGSSLPGVKNPVQIHRQILEETGIFADVFEGYLKQAPLLDDVLRQISTDTLFVVPMLTGHGYITDELIPGALSALSERCEVRMCEPIGCHHDIAKLFAGRVRAILDGNDLAPENVSTVLAAHGNRTNPQNALQAKALAQAVQDICGVATNAMFIEEAPLISDWMSISTTKDLIVLPFMIGGGRHGAEDVPTMIGLDPQNPDLLSLGPEISVAGPFEVQSRRVWYSRALGHEPALASITIDLVTVAQSSDNSSRPSA